MKEANKNTSLNTRLTKEIYKNIGEYEVTYMIGKTIIYKRLQDVLEIPTNMISQCEMYRHKNNVYILNKTILKHYNLQSKQLKETITSHNEMDLYKMIGYFLNINIQKDIKLNKEFSKIDKKHTKTMKLLQIDDVYFTVSFAYGLPAVMAYKIIDKNKSSIKVEVCKLQKKITPKTIKYEIIGTSGETFLVKVYKNQDFQINGSNLVKASSNKIVVKL